MLSDILKAFLKLLIRYDYTVEADETIKATYIT